MKKPAIPSPAAVQDPIAQRTLLALKSSVEIITGAVGTELAVLPATATLADVIGAINEIIRRINRSGT